MTIFTHNTNLPPYDHLSLTIHSALPAAPSTLEKICYIPPTHLLYANVKFTHDLHPKNWVTRWY